MWLRPALPGLAAALVLGAAATPAAAQLGLPRITPPSLARDLPRLPTPAETLQPGLSLPNLRANTVHDLLREHAALIEADPRGEPIRRQELLLVSPPRSTVDAALAQGFTLLREQALPALDLVQVLLRAPAGVGTAEALAMLRVIDPSIEADFNHLYLRSGAASLTPAAQPAAQPAAVQAASGGSRRVGLVDGGIDTRHVALRKASVRRWGCEDRDIPSPHGTAVASLLVGRDGGFSGALPEAALYAADIYCGQPTGGAAETLAMALAWLAQEQVAVINLSLVGPANRLLERAVRALLDKGHLVIAAVGNDGPAAAALFPAAYPGVVGVTGVTPARRVLPEAAQGRHVMFAAPGADLAVASPSGAYVAARGTSFAAPLVAGLLAASLPRPDRLAAAAALVRLGESAQDLGTAGRDDIFGQGLVGERLRVLPHRMQATAP